MMLSILIPVIPQHEQKFNELLQYLTNQINQVDATANVEILWSSTESQINGGPSSGTKRQLLLQVLE